MSKPRVISLPAGILDALRNDDIDAYFIRDDERTYRIEKAPTNWRPYWGHNMPEDKPECIHTGCVTCEIQEEHGE